MSPENKQHSLTRLTALSFPRSMRHIALQRWRMVGKRCGRQSGRHGCYHFFKDQAKQAPKRYRAEQPVSLIQRNGEPLGLVLTCADEAQALTAQVKNKPIGSPFLGSVICTKC